MERGMTCASALVLAVMAMQLWAGGPAAMIVKAEPGRMVRENVFEYPTRDERMAEATRRAHATLPRFFELADRRLQGSYLVKMAHTHAGHTEHLWVEVTDYDGVTFGGLLSNEPAHGSPLRIGDHVTVRKSAIGDWMINTGEFCYGGYSIRAIMDDMPEASAAQFRGKFRD